MGIKIVYIDDEVDMCLMFFENFSSSDVVIKTFSDMTDISKRVESESPDIIFLDYRLPNTTGDQLSSFLMPQVPKVLLTGDVFLEPKGKYLKVFTKPFDFKEMENFISDFARKKAFHQSA